MRASSSATVLSTRGESSGNTASDRYGTNLIAVSRKDQRISQKLHQVRFELGDVLVLQGSAAAMLDNLKDLHCLPLVDRSTRLCEPRQEYLALILLAAAMTSASIGLIPVPAAFFAADSTITVPDNTRT